MFGTKKTEKPGIKKPLAIDKADIKAFMGAGSRFEGKLDFDELVRLDGHFVGNIHSTDTLIIGESAVVEGQIEVGAVILSGRFVGTIRATATVELRAPARMEGTIETPCLKIDERAVFNGDIRMTDSADKSRSEGAKKPTQPA